MSLRTHIRIICVAGAHSRVGKTTLCSILLKEFRGYGAVKFTKDPFDSALIDDEKIIMQKGKDTAIMASSGAERVILVSGDGERLRNALERALIMMSPLKGVLIEGNRPIEFLNPDLLIFVIGPDRKIKPDALKILRLSDIVIINSVEKTSFVSDMLKPNARIFFADLRKGGGGIREVLSDIKRSLSEI